MCRLVHETFLLLCFNFHHTVEVQDVAYGMKFVYSCTVLYIRAFFVWCSMESIITLS